MKLFEVLQSNPREFKGRSTETKGKLNATEWASERSYIKPNNNICMYLVGDPEGLERHVINKMDLGFTDLSKHVAVEIAPVTCRALQQERDRLAQQDPEFAKIDVECGDIVQVAQRFPRGSITHLDFDTASAFTKATERAVVQLANLNIRNIHLVFDQRNRSGYFNKKWPKERGGWEERYAGSVKKLRPPKQQHILKPILQELVGDKYHVTFPISYQGTNTNGRGSSMIMVVLNKKS